MKQNNLFMILAVAALVYFITKKKDEPVETPPIKISGFDNNIGIF